ncbi:bifunctional chorismate mutase/prephenate dehydrogenase [Marinicella gelatinilytica]|uniref:bifunctional chorismate mutase/prephenate dehydrogenase n=1 Tax=Marinicella gelatinilytica TaxID=2996017 RepID=UPI002260CBA6|nr:bifunctional chorismate mutase/prephenate dehydrogenase [Marinicella gelatinilytica]MCX7546073.1 bifunctional chorismate mutase/prephenate dehydrogenase [Marinicella gelatinilytica]
MKNQKLSQLRQRLDDIDEQIIALIAERQFNVELIGNVKLDTKSPTRDYGREKQVINHIRATAEDKSLNPDIAQQIFELIIETSLSKQEVQKVKNSSYGHNKKALIIGGNGKMGQWFAHFLQEQNFTVEINDIAALDNQQNFIADINDIELNHDFIIVATPIQKSADILEQLQQHQPSGVVMDISSIKSPLRRPLRALSDSGCRVVSIHPMFGPDVQLLSNKHVIFIDMGDQQALDSARQLFQPTMVEQIDMKFEDHDRLISYVLGLSHLLNITFMTVLAESGEAADLLANLSSTTFDAQWNIAAKVTHENPDLYYEIQKLNQYSPTIINALDDTVERLKQILHNNQQTAFVQLMQQAKDYLAIRHHP